MAANFSRRGGVEFEASKANGGALATPIQSKKSNSRPMKSDEAEILVQNMEKRKQTLKEHADFLTEMIEGKKSLLGFRKKFRLTLEQGANTTFRDYDEEYDFVGKFGRGMWCHEDLEEAFDEEEMETIVSIARGYGAFDY